MRVSTRGRYALRMAVELAERYESGYTALNDVAESQEISKKYLEQIASLLSKGGVIVSSRGTQGGYVLAKSPEEITVFDVLRCTEGELNCVDCLKDNGDLCDRSDKCKAREIWKGMNNLIIDYCKQITLHDILQKHRFAP